MIAWSVSMGGPAFTFITDQCKDEDAVRAAMLEKFCRPAVSVVRL